MTRTRILSVGQCGYDHGRISRLLGQDLGAEVVDAATHPEALEELRRGGFSLVLINRVGDEDGAPGLDLIRSLRSDPALAPVPVMLVSNFPEAQSQALALGALPGFGKDDLADRGLSRRIASAIGIS